MCYVYTMVSMDLWGKHKVYGGQGKATAYDKFGDVHTEQAGR